MSTDLTYLWPVVHDAVHQFASSPLLPLIHAVGVAYHLRKAFPPQKDEPFLQGFLRHILVALGGGTLAAILTARPVPILLSNSLLPLYTLGHIAVFYTPFVYTILRAIYFTFEPLWIVTDAFARSWALCYGLDGFRAHPTYGAVAREAIIGQLALGVVSVTAGGIMFKWFTGIKRYHYPGWNFSVVILATTFYVAFVNEELKAAAVEHIRPLSVYGKKVGVPEVLGSGDMRIICGLVMAVGFLLGEMVPVSNSKTQLPPKVVVKSKVAPSKSGKKD
ncbi:uncharacterized protein SPPG_04494 [Spizellomyces punctatus DAOM BR117]|uniref:Uncharacterized protein n=1 Tax=Spizellomyces punctatus (strain DAOM BR117) TaxID=645134 RepID=A0A0L0HGE2_SPIPD|nr:uncharacterized protein SPPG_04494 [Spizellomyces punctatus DAOM BR117]KND00153.1 hypothetical protein SPPG_04494 [Spizellomyces punctatus DAOM BR117]|eukprot:XP_016608192.1 hypothetical protein SPPG_04494 [Spizellomyces punctatus DAOM BR117]